MEFTASNTAKWIYANQTPEVAEGSFAFETMVVEAMASQVTTTFCAFTEMAARKANASETTSRVIFNLSLLERQKTRRVSVRRHTTGSQPPDFGPVGRRHC